MFVLIIGVILAIAGLLIFLSREKHRENVLDLLRQSIASQDYARELASELFDQYHKEPIKQDFSMDELYQLVENLKNKQLRKSMIIGTVLVDNRILIFTESIITAVSMDFHEIRQGDEKTYLIFSLLKNEEAKTYEVRSTMQENNQDKIVKRDFGQTLLEIINHG
jgi:IS30 family transposase